MKPLSYGLGGIIAVIIAGVGGYFGLTDQQAQKPYLLGDTVENFTLKNIYNETISLSDHSARHGYIVLFTSNSCPYSLLYEERMMQLADTCNEAGFTFLVLNPNDPDLKPGDGLAELVRRADSLQYNFPYLIDDKNLFSKFGAEKTPQVFVLDRNKILCYRGAIDDNVQSADRVKSKYLDDVMRALTNGENPVLRETRVVGCTIKGRS